MGNTLENKQAMRSMVSLPLINLAPATLAVLIQCIALILVVLSLLVIDLFTTLYVPIISLILLQSLFATGLSVLVRMASWWRWIHFCFPLALFGMSMWQIPKEVYLFGFIVSLSLFWTTFRSQVPFFPSRPIIWEKVVELIPYGKSIRMIDIGSGLGDLAMHIAKARTDSQIHGIEIAPLPWAVSAVRAYLKGSSANFKLGDYYELNFSQYDVVFAYLSPAAMTALWKKAQNEMQSGSLLISYEFEIPGVNPSFTIASGKESSQIFVWKI